jgi:hypothetical protein
MQRTKILDTKATHWYAEVLYTLGSSSTANVVIDAVGYEYWNAGL